MSRAIPNQVFELSAIDRALQPEVGQALPAVLAGLYAARGARRTFHRVMSRAESKEFAGLQAEAALREFVLERLEDDLGFEVLIATRGAETIRFCSHAEVIAWLESERAHGTEEARA